MEILDGHVVSRVTATSIGIAPRETRRYKPGRVCAGEDCSTVLSIYNSEKWCALHAPFNPYLIGGRPRGQHGGSRAEAVA